MKIVFLGGGQWGLFPLKRLLQKEQVTGIVAPGQDPLVVREGLKKQIPTCEITSKHEPKFEAFLKACRPDLIVVAGFSFILPKEILDIPLKGTINLHGSLLPAYRGPQPLEWQIINGEKNAGVTVHFIDEKIDSGDILMQAEIPILETDTLKTMALKLSRKGCKLLEDTLARFKRGPVQGIPQNHHLSSYYGKITTTDRKIDWTSGRMAIFNLVRGLSPNAPAFSDFENVRCHIFRVLPVTSKPSGAPGQIICRKSVSHPMIVSTSDGNVAVFEYTLSGCNGRKLFQEAANDILIPGRFFSQAIKPRLDRVS